MAKTTPCNCSYRVKTRPALPRTSTSLPASPRPRPGCWPSSATAGRKSNASPTSVVTRWPSWKSVGKRPAKEPRRSAAETEGAPGRMGAHRRPDQIPAQGNRNPPANQQKELGSSKPGKRRGTPATGPGGAPVTPHHTAHHNTYGGAKHAPLGQAPSTALPPANARHCATRLRGSRPAHRGASAALRGRLRLPVKGEIAGRFGTPRADTGATWKGLFILLAAKATRCGPSPQAELSSRLVARLRQPVDHRPWGWPSVHLRQQSIGLPQHRPERESGDTIATVGSSGGQGESGLYFELRLQGQAFDPLKWASLR